MSQNKKAQMAHVINLISIANLDGQITETEKDLIYRIAESLGLTPDEFETCVNTSNSAGDGGVVYEVPENDNDKVTYLKNLTTLMMIDGQIDEAEKKYIKIIAEKFGFDGDKALEILMNSVYEDFRKVLGEQPQQKEGITVQTGGGNTRQTGGGNTRQTVKKEEPMSDEEFKQETLRYIELGKKALIEHNIPQAFEYLLIPAHVDGNAMRLFLMIVNTRQRIFAIREEQAEQLKGYAEKGYALSQYAYGRYLEATRPDASALNTANEYFKKAEQGGIADALYAQAILMKAGHYGMVNLSESNKMIDDALEKDSTLAARYILRQSIYGWNDHAVDPQHTIDILNKWLDGDESDDIMKVNPMYYDIMGEAYAALDDHKNAHKYYAKAIKMGYMEACSNLCLLYSDDENYLEMLEKGCEEGDALCYVYLAAYYMDNYDSFDCQKQKELTGRIKQLLKDGVEKGSDIAPYFMGDAYYDGKYGFEQDDNEAWNWFIEGSHRDDGSAYKMLAVMITENKNPYDVSDGLVEYCAIMALRNGDDDMLDVVVEGYRDGLLTDYAAEIEMYYIPKYDKLHENDEEEEEDEEEEKEEGDAQHKLIAIVKTNCKADIIEFDVEEGWNELPEFVNAGRLDAIRVQPLYDIGNELGLRDHITGWVDNMGLMKDLPMNPIGCKIYPGPIAGDMILTLEDAKYNPKSFEDLDELKQVIAQLGAKLENVFLEDEPNDDGK